jgi:hypothetical protein
MKHNIYLYDDYYRYNGYVLVNEIYEDDDHRANTWYWGKLSGKCIVDPQLLTGLSSNSYAPWEEVVNVFQQVVDNVGV